MTISARIQESIKARESKKELIPEELDAEKKYWATKLAEFGFVVSETNIRTTSSFLGTEGIPFDQKNLLMQRTRVTALFQGVLYQEEPTGIFLTIYKTPNGYFPHIVCIQSRELTPQLSFTEMTKEEALSQVERVVQQLESRESRISEITVYTGEEISALTKNR